MTAVGLVYAGVLISILGLISTFKPLKLLRISTRSRGMIVVLAGVAFISAGFAVPVSESRVANARSRLDEFAPVYQFSEFHSIRVNAAPDRVYAAIKTVRADEIPFFRTLTWIRRGGRPLAPGILNAPGNQALLDVATRTSFLLLAEEPNHEIVLGTAVLVPPDWRPTKRPTAEDFKSLQAPGFALASMNFLVEPAGANSTLVTTETRVYATDAGSASKFARYWRVIYPGSALIRRMWLRAIRQRAEAERPQSAAHDGSGTM